MGATTILIGGRAEATPHTEVISDSANVGTTCPTCQRSFSADGQFCPYDGERLGADTRQQSEQDPLLGSIVDDRYEVLAVIGEGGMGRVYRVRHRRLGRAFALKALRVDLARDAVLAERFIQEARAAAVVSHPNVVQINDFGTLSSGQPYFVMELLEGRTLTRILRDEGPIEPGRCAAIARQIAEALAAAHAMGVIHRDLKPDNVILVRPIGAHTTVKVLDFGLAKVAGSSRLTRPGVVFGTPHYMSPEQAGGESFDHRVDIYALGIVMFEMLTGRVPFEADTYMGVLSKHLYAAPPSLHEYHPPAGGLAGFEALIAGCLAKKPDDRWPGMTELARRLNALIIPPPGVSRPPVTDDSPSNPSDELPSIPTVQSWPWYVAGAAALLAIIGGIWWHFSRHPASGQPDMGVAAAAVTALPRQLSRSELGPPVSERPLDAPIVPVSAATTGPNESPASVARRPPPSKPARKESKASVKNTKRQSIESGDIADPWAK